MAQLCLVGEEEHTTVQGLGNQDIDGDETLMRTMTIPIRVCQKKARILSDDITWTTRKEKRGSPAPGRFLGRR